MQDPALFHYFTEVDLENNQVINGQDFLLITDASADMPKDIEKGKFWFSREVNKN